MTSPNRDRNLQRLEALGVRGEALADPEVGRWAVARLEDLAALGAEDAPACARRLLDPAGLRHLLAADDRPRIRAAAHLSPVESRRACAAEVRARLETGDPVTAGAWLPAWAEVDPHEALALAATRRLDPEQAPFTFAGLRGALRCIRRVAAAGVASSADLRSAAAGVLAPLPAGHEHPDYALVVAEGLATAAWTDLDPDALPALRGWWGATCEAADVGAMDALYQALAPGEPWFQLTTSIYAGETDEQLVDLAPFFDDALDLSGVDATARAGDPPSRLPAPDDLEAGPLARRAAWVEGLATSPCAPGLASVLGLALALLRHRRPLDLVELTALDAAELRSLDAREVPQSRDLDAALIADAEALPTLVARLEARRGTWGEAHLQEALGRWLGYHPASWYRGLPVLLGTLAQEPLNPALAESSARGLVSMGVGVEGPVLDILRDLPLAGRRAASRALACVGGEATYGWLLAQAPAQDPETGSWCDLARAYPGAELQAVARQVLAPTDPDGVELLAYLDALESVGEDPDHG